MDITFDRKRLRLRQERAQFARANPEALQRRSGAVFDADAGLFAAQIFGKKVRVTWPEGEVSRPGSESVAGDEFSALLLGYLLRGHCAARTGSFLPYAELWGQSGAAALRRQSAQRLAHGFAQAPENFARACAALGGMPLPMADYAFEIPFLEELRVQLLLWEGGDTFCPAAEILFSDNFPLAFEAEDVPLVCSVLLRALEQA